MRLLVLLLGLTLLLAGAGASHALVAGGSVSAQAPQVKVESVVTGLEVPWSLAFAPDGRLFIAERPGRIRVFQDGQLLATPLVTIPVFHFIEAGLMGLTLDPDFAANGFLYVCYTYKSTQGATVNRISRFTAVGNTGQNETVLLDGIAGENIHNGCRIKFGPDGKLYATMGEASQPNLAQDLASLNGKVLRLNPDGSVPADNPFPGSYVLTYGHRNPQGLAFHPLTGKLFITEHGPAFGDEVNIVIPGKNYGWPFHAGVANNPNLVDPILEFTPTIAPAGATFSTGNALPAEWRNNLFFVTLRAAHVHRVVLDPVDNSTVLSHEELFSGQFGRLRDIVQGPDGFLYFTTSNRDGRGTATAGDDRVLRIVPGVSSTPTPLPGVRASLAVGLAAGLGLLSLWLVMRRRMRQP